MGAVLSRGSFGDTVLSKRKTWLRQRQGCLFEEYRREIPIFYLCISCIWIIWCCLKGTPKAFQCGYVHDVPTALGEIPCNSEPEKLRGCGSAKASVVFPVLLLALSLLLVRFPTKLALRVAGLVHGGRSTLGIRHSFHTTAASLDHFYVRKTERNGIRG